MKQLFVFIFISFTLYLTAQTTPTRSTKGNIVVDDPTFFEKKWRVGIEMNQAWSRFIGTDLPYKYFFKPNLGLGIKAQYLFNKNWGITFGVTYQQRGAGIINIDSVHAIGNPDSTYRQRTRMNCVDIPIHLIWIANKGVHPDSRWSGSFGIAPTFIAKTGSIFMSVEDNFQPIINLSKSYSRFDIAASASFGLDFIAPAACLFRLHAFADFGFINPYNDKTLFKNARGYNFLVGIRLNALFGVGNATVGGKK